MVYIQLALVVFVFMFTVYVASRFLQPCYTDGDSGGGKQQAAVVSALLVGSSAGVVVDHLWVAIRSLTGAATALSPGFSEAVVATALDGIFLDGGALLGLAALVHLLSCHDASRSM